MLETLISSRIRRTLFEHLVAHPEPRFYLRGLAKQLGLAVSPLRRELKRLERLGVLKTEQEGNLLFYTINPASPLFLQLKQAVQQTDAPSPESLEARGSPAPAFARGGPGGLACPGSSEQEAGGAVAHSPEPSAHSRGPLPVGVVSMGPRSSPPQSAPWASSLNSPALLGTAVVGLALMLIVTLLFYFNLVRQQASPVSPALSGQKAGVGFVAPPSPSSGVMRGSRWQLLPGGFGGFSSSAKRTEESY